MRLPHIAALCLLLLLPFGARADDIGPDQAQALQQQLTNWLARSSARTRRQAAGTARTGGLPASTTTTSTTWPIPGLTSPAGEAATTANVRPLDGGRWSIEALKLPPSGTFTMTIPNGGDDGKGASDGPAIQHRSAGHAWRDPPGARQRIHPDTASLATSWCVCSA